MLTQTPTEVRHSASTPDFAPPERNRYVGGAVLIILGVALLIGPLTGWHFSWMALPTMAVIFLAWGLLMRSLGLLIPGGILAGIALGVTLMQNSASLSDGTGGAAIFMFCFAAGWVLIAVLSPLTTAGFSWWPLIPAAIMAMVGGALALNQPSLLSWFGYIGPLFLIGLGAWLIVRQRNE